MRVSVINLQKFECVLGNFEKVYKIKKKKYKKIGQKLDILYRN